VTWSGPAGEQGAFKNPSSPFQWIFLPLSGAVLLREGQEGTWSVPDST
jgi:hypothetical protein